MNFKIINVLLPALITLACLTLVYNLLFTDFMAGKIAGPKKTFFISILLTYSAFRIYRIYNVLKK